MSKEKILAYKLRVNKETGEAYKGYFEEIDNTLEALQKYVGGYIETVRLTDEIVVVVNEEGKYKNMRPNRAWLHKERILDILVGDLLCVRYDEEGNFASILENDDEIILRYLKPVMSIKNACILVPEFICHSYKGGSDDEHEN